eukprot:9495811-Karenia_brevis.AAC.1
MALRRVQTLSRRDTIAVFTDSNNWVQILNLSAVPDDLSELASECFEEIRNICSDSNLFIFHVEGHSGIIYNEVADRLCTSVHGCLDRAFFTKHGLDLVPHLAQDEIGHRE